MRECYDLFMVLTDTESPNGPYKAIDEGVTFIDTADVYGFGHSEELIAN